MTSMLRRSCVNALLVAGALPAFGQGNNVPLNNDADVAFLFSDPSSGGATGTFPPDLTGDLFWRTLPGDRVLAHDGAGGATVEIDGYFELILDTDWSTPPSFYDRLEGPALPSATNPGNLEPAFFQLGLTTEVLISLGPTGLPDPCLLYPSLCSPSGCSVGGGGVWGYWVSIRFPAGSGIFVPADGSAGSDHATTWLLPGGMIAPPDMSFPCLLSDYTIATATSTDETQADDLGGISALSGLQLAGGGPIADPVTRIPENHMTFRERFLNVLADSGTGVMEGSCPSNGGATNALKLTVGSGAARLSYEVRAAGDVGRPNQAFAVSSFTALGPPGVPVLGALLLVAPDPLFSTTAALTAAAGQSITAAAGGTANFTWTIGGATPVILDIPATAAGIDVYSQGFVLFLDTLTAAHTNRVRTSFLP